MEQIPFCLSLAFSLTVMQIFQREQNKARQRENQLLKFRLCIPVSEFYPRDVINFIYQVGDGHLFASHRCTSLHLPLVPLRAATAAAASSRFSCTLAF